MSTIILGTDLSDNALTAARWAFGLAQAIEETDGDAPELVIAHIVAGDEMQLREVIADHSQEEEVDDLHQEIEEWLHDVATGDVDYNIEIRVGRGARSLSELCEERDADWLIVGKSGRGRLAKLFLGSTAEHLALRPPCPLLLIDPDDDPWEDSLDVVSAFDLTYSAADAFYRGAELVKLNKGGGQVNLLHVIAIPHNASPLIEGPHVIPETLEAHLEESTNWARDEIDVLLHKIGPSLDAISPTVDIRPGYPIHEILTTVNEKQANLLTLGSRGRSRIADFMLGGIGRSVLKRAPCSVLLAPPEQKSESDDQDED